MAENMFYPIEKTCFRPLQNMFSLQGEHVFKHLILTKFKKNVKHVLAMAENMFSPIEKTCFLHLTSMFPAIEKHVFAHFKTCLWTQKIM